MQFERSVLAFMSFPRAHWTQIYCTTHSNG
jgi:hypothetical protein